MLYVSLKKLFATRPHGKATALGSSIVTLSNAKSGVAMFPLVTIGSQSVYAVDELMTFP